MDRNKSIKRGPKVKTLALPNELIVLGSKAGTSKSTSGDSLTDIKLGSATAVGHKGVGGTGSSGDRKRDASGAGSVSPLGGPLSKKVKLSIADDDHYRSRTGSVSWEAIAVDVDPSVLVAQVVAAEDAGNDDRVERLLCGSVKLLRRFKAEASLYLALLFLAKTRPNLFCSNLVTEAFCSLLKREVVQGFKVKLNSLGSILAANVLLAAYRDDENWPDTFVKIYLEDALGERLWVDHEECRGFVLNIVTAFNTKLPPKEFFPPELAFRPDAAASPPAVSFDQDEDVMEGSQSADLKETSDVTTFPRYLHLTEAIEQFVVEVIRDQVNRRQPMDNISRNVLRVLTSTCGIGEVRLLVVQKLEMWMQNPKLTRQAQELLLAVCLNCGQHHQQDVDIIGHLIKIRLKTKPLVNHYLQCIRELLSQHSENLSTVLKHTIYNELSNSRNPNNMGLLGVIFQHSPEHAAKVLAEVFQDVLNNREDYLRAVRGLFREVVRSLRHDMNFPAFCLGLMTERKESHFLEMEASVRERLFLSIIDLITLSVFMSITPVVREVALSRAERKDVSALRNYQRQVAEIERDAIWWLHNIAPKVYKPGKNEFVHCLQKVLFMEQPEHYYNKDNWPQESERLIMLRLASEVPLLEDTLLWILLIGLSKDHPLNASDALELVDQLVKRVALLHAEDFQVIEIQRIDLINIVFNICAYHHPENISLPIGYQAPSLAIATLYWKAWILLLIITAHNPLTFGFVAWENYPTLRCFMEMCITNHFSFPPPTIAFGEKADEIKAKELQICQLERQEILEFENHLASASSKVVITETNSLLLSQLTTMDPSGLCRRPPTHVIEQLKSLNYSLKLGHLLCRTRNPDFLLDIIQRQGTSQSMPWLANLVESSEGSFDVLPVQCLCEFLLNEQLDVGEGSSASEKDEGKEETKAEKVEKIRRKEKQRKQQQLLKHLQEVLYSRSPHPQQTIEVLDYFLRRLESSQTTARHQALRGLALVLSLSTKSDDDEEEDAAHDDGGDMDKNAWLLRHLPTLPHFETVRYQTSLAVRQACQVENDPVTMSGYIHFLADYAPDDQLQDLADLALDVAHLIVQRTTVINYLLPFGAQSTSDSSLLLAFLVIFIKYLRKAREPSKEAYSWSESQDQIIVQWSTGEAATMHVLVVHAMIVLLTYGPPRDYALFEELLDVWFPLNVEPPQAYLVDTSEEALLYPDWLKLRMIRSSVEVLVDAALKDLEPAQLVLFIQSFGIPIMSISKLLRALDAAVEYDSYTVESVVVDKVYMAQLVEVQQQRGARYGQQFASFLGLMSEEPVSGLDEDVKTISQEPMSVSVIRQVSPVIGQQIRPLQMPSFNECEVPSKIRLLFGLDPLHATISQTDRYGILRTIQKELSCEARQQLLDKPCSKQIVNFLAGALESADSSTVIEALLSNHTSSCPIFRLLVMSCSKQGVISNPLTTALQNICKIIMDYWRTSKPEKCSSLIAVIRPMIGHDSKDRCRDRGPKDDLDQDSIIQVITDAVKKNPAHVERVVRQLLRTAMASGRTGNLISSLTVILTGRTNSSSESTLISLASNGLLVDYLELLEPEVIGSSSELQQQLLFRKRSQLFTECLGRPTIYKTCRPYLLATLIHQANWETLKSCISLLLCEDLQRVHLDESRYDPTTVLDFLWACVYIPKIWQGREKHIPKHCVEEDVLHLTDSQVLNVAHYIMAEVGRDLDVTKEKSWSVIEARMPLLLRCCNYRPPVVQHLVQHLVKVIEANAALSALAHSLLLNIYLQMPQLIRFIKKKKFIFEDTSCTINTPSKLDPVSHTLLTALSNTNSIRDWKEKMQDLDLLCRKLAATHPILMLRQLPMIASCLRGCVHLEFSTQNSRRHTKFYTCVLALLELLQPHLFKMEYSSSFELVCDSYFSLIKSNGFQNKDLASLVGRFLALLLDFMSVDTQRAVRYVQRHAVVLKDLSSLYPDSPSLRSILSVVSLPHQTFPFEGDADVDGKEPSFLSSFAPPQQVPTFSSVQLAPIAARLSNVNSVDEISSALHDLDGLSHRKVGILEYFTDEIKALLAHPTENCRSLAHNLMIRYLKHKPNASEEFLDAFLSCFESDRYDVITTTLERLAEFVFLNQEHASLLLQRVFHVNMITNINTAPYISEVFMVLNMQGGK